MAGNLIDTGVADRLIKAHYLHSNTENFVEVVRQHQGSLVEGKRNNATLIEIKTRLEKLLREANRQMNIFYEDLSNYYSSIGQSDKIIVGRDDYKNDVYIPAGANEFSRKFLIDRPSQEQMGPPTEEKVILSIINSPQSIIEIRKAYDKVVSQSINTIMNLDKEQQKLITNLEKSFNQKLPGKIEEMTYGMMQKFLDSLFVSNREKRGFGLQIQTTSNTPVKQISDELKQQIKELGIEDFSPRNEKTLQQLRNTLTQKLKDKNLYYLVGLEYWKYLNLEFKKKTGRALHGAKAKKFANFFSKTMMNYKNMNLTEDVSQEQSLKGFVLEFGLFASVNLPLNADNQIANILGQEQVIRKYIMEEINSTNNKISSTKKVGGQSPSDIEYVGMSGKRYRFQLKNNFNNEQSHLSFRSQAKIKVSTYLPTALNGVSEDVKDILIYLLINAAFLRKYGLGPYNASSEPITFSPSQYPIIKEYILFFLQQTYQFLVGYQYDNQLRIIEGITAGNLAYIFQGRYLIPVAAYFYSALEMINKVLNGQHKLQGIGGIAGLPRFENNKLPISNVDFQKNKNKLMKKINFNDVTYGTYKYPSTLSEYGGSYGSQLYNQLTFERISIVLEIEKLERYFK